MADVLLHVVDSSSDVADQHILVVNNILKELGAASKPIIMVYNKIDLKQDDIHLPQDRQMVKGSVEVSARTGKGINDLLELMDDIVPGKKIKVKICVPYSVGNMVSQIHEKCDVLREEYTQEGTVMNVLVDEVMFGRVKEYIVGSEE